MRDPSRDVRGEDLGQGCFGRLRGIHAHSSRARGPFEHCRLRSAGTHLGRQLWPSARSSGRRARSPSIHLNTLVHNCGFRLAWFGSTESDTSNAIRLVAQAGDQDGFLQETSCSEPPATMAIEAGEPCWIKAMADSAFVVPIRAAALKRGYTSGLSIPFKSDGRLFGALTIYADDPGKLDEPIVERLREWSDIFALRVKTLRAHEERDGADTLNKDLQHVADRQRLENQLRLIIDTTPALIHSARPDGYLDYFNKPWVAYLGVSLEDVEGWKWTASIHPDDVEGIVQRWRSSLASGEPFVHEARVRRADGAYRWSWSKMWGWAWRRRALRGSSSPFIRPNRRAWAWAWRSAARSLRPAVAGSGRRPIASVAPRCISPCQRARNGDERTERDGM